MYYDSGEFSQTKEINTKSVTISEFVNRYSGPEVQLPIRYSFIFNTIFVTFTYGLAIPILFLTTTITLINVYITETILFAYYYQKPPVYGQGMNDGALKILTHAPLFMICFGYWQLGNRQIFFNEAYLKDIGSEEYNPGHKLIDFSKGINHTALFFVFLPMFVFFRPYLKLLKKVALKMNIAKKINGISLDWTIDV